MQSNRKSNLKELLKVIDGSDIDLVREARNSGFKGSSRKAFINL
jgi:hypothetical protein